MLGGMLLSRPEKALAICSLSKPISILDFGIVDLGLRPVWDLTEGVQFRFLLPPMVRAWEQYASVNPI